jgi:hypothetical protein
MLGVVILLIYGMDSSLADTNVDERKTFDQLLDKTPQSRVVYSNTKVPGMNGANLSGFSIPSPAQKFRGN